MGMSYLDSLEDMLCEELKDITRKGSLNAGTLESANLLTDTIKNIYKIRLLSGEDREGFVDGGVRESNGHEKETASSDRSTHHEWTRSSHMERRDHVIGDLEGMMQSATGEERDVYKRAAELLRKL